MWGRAPDLTGLRWCGALQTYLTDGQPLAGEDSPMAELLTQKASVMDRELTYERPDGSRIHVLANLEPRFGPDGTFLGGINCFQDITARKKEEERARQAELFSRLIFDTTPDCIKVVSRDGLLVQMNQSGIEMVEGGCIDEIVGKPVADLVLPEFRDEWLANHARVCAGEKLAWEFDIRGLHGTTRKMSTHAAPIEMPDGSIAQLAITRDATKRKNNELRIRESEHQLRELLDALPAAVYTTDTEGRIKYFNQAAEALAGRTPTTGDRWSVSWKLSNPDGSDLPLDACPLAITLKTGETVRGQEMLSERPDGSRVWLMPYPTPLHDSTGQLTGAVNMLVDVTEIRRAEREQKLLIDELNHRVKNTLASVQSFVSLTARDSTNVESYRRALEGRIMAMSRAHDQLSRSKWTFARLAPLVEAELGAYQKTNSIVVDGPSIEIEPRTALILSMAIHELATNASKYGALSIPDGKVEVVWRLREGEAEAPELRITWREIGGPIVKPPDRKGFGSLLLQRGVPAEVGGRTTIDYAEDGLVCDIEIALKHE